MIVGRHVMFWVAAVAVAGLTMWVLGEVLLPFVVAFALAYLFNPIANRLEAAGIPRWLGALSIIGGIVLLVVVLFVLMVPLLLSQLSALLEALPGYLRRLQGFISDPGIPWLRQLVPGGLLGNQQAVSDLVAKATGWLGTFAASLWSGGRALISILSLAVVTPVVTFYLIKDWPKMLATLDRLIPKSDRRTVRALAREIDAALAGFIRGQTIVCWLLGAYYAVALSLVGLKFGLLIGVTAGLLTFIPYVGSTIGLLTGVGVAAAQFWPDWFWIAFVLGIFLIGQFLEANVVSPKLVGESVGLHPVWIIFALFAFGYLFGFLGLVLAVPLAATAGVLIRFAIRRYLASPLYTGGEVD